jgi:uncharacterized protein (DUF305 family)
MEKSDERQGARMNVATRHLATLAVVALAAAFAAGATLLVHADDGSRLAPHLCTASIALSEEVPFLDENSVAMTKMMTDMAVKPTGDVDADFVAMMVPHHQGAIEMARTVLRYGNNAKIKRLAQEIIVTQQQEIAVMRLALGEPLPPSVPSPTQLSVQPVLDNR